MNRSSVVSYAFLDGTFEAKAWAFVHAPPEWSQSSRLVAPTTRPGGEPWTPLRLDAGKSDARRAATMCAHADVEIRPTPAGGSVLRCYARPVMMVRSAAAPAKELTSSAGVLARRMLAARDRPRPGHIGTRYPTSAQATARTCLLQTDGQQDVGAAPSTPARVSLVDRERHNPMGPHSTAHRSGYGKRCERALSLSASPRDPD